MARVDDYLNAKKLAVSELAGMDVDAMVQGAGLEKIDGHNVGVPFLDHRYRITCPAYEFFDETQPNHQVPIQEQVLILHYILGTRKKIKLTGNWISYREIPGASFYFSAFVKRATNPLKKVFGDNPAALKNAAPLIHAQPIDMGDAGYQVAPLPLVPIQLIIWQGDDEFPSEANILFDESVGDVLSPEDVAWLAGMVVYRLMALAG
ncbi:MAG: DUF3786 domain-containing protein [Desulfobacteraceae bacterium]|nr:DUF3786 domain-containing protein [Desulfobacteraceae bacterium]